MQRPKISVIVNFYNMQREAKRTLYSLTAEYQKGISAEDYEVIAVDNGSSEPLSADWVESLGANFHYIFYDATSPSPCAAINYAVGQSRHDITMICIDGARILSPGLLSTTQLSASLHSSPFVYSMAMHIGASTQNEALLEGYNQEVEDALFDTVDWMADGYRLFTISSVAKSSGRGFFSQLAESNCCALRKDDYISLGALDEQLASRGGGLANHDLFNRAQLNPAIEPILLLGEATFHQFHGGVATNVPLETHPWQEFAEEYQRVKGEEFRLEYRPPLYIGRINDYSRPFLCS